MRWITGSRVWRMGAALAAVFRDAAEAVREERERGRDFEDVITMRANEDRNRLMFETDPLAPRWDASFDDVRNGMLAAVEHAAYRERYSEMAARIDAVTFAPMRTQRINRRADGWSPAKLRKTDRSGAVLGLAVVEVAHCGGCPGHGAHSYFRPRMWTGGTEWVRRAWEAAGHTVTRPAMERGGVL